MKRYAIDFTPSAVKELARLPRKEREAVGLKIDSLAVNPRPQWAAMTKGTLQGLWKFRVGNYRVAYSIEDDRLVVLVIAVANRKEIYREAARRRR